MLLPVGQWEEQRRQQVGQQQDWGPLLRASSQAAVPGRLGWKADLIVGHAQQ